MTNIGRSERNIAHRLIEEFMLAANRAVAHYLNAARPCTRCIASTKSPTPEKVLEFEELARAFGYSLGVENLHQREVAVRHGKVPAPAQGGRPDSYGHGRERQHEASLCPPRDICASLRSTISAWLQKLSGKPEERISPT